MSEADGAVLVLIVTGALAIGYLLGLSHGNRH